MYVYIFALNILPSWSRKIHTNLYSSHQCMKVTASLSPRWHSVQFSRSVVSNSLQPHGLQHSRPPCPSPTPRVYPNSSCPLSRWCHLTISSSVVLFSSCPQSFPASGSFPMSQLITSSGQSTEVSASASVLPMNIQDWFPLGLNSLISFKGLWRVFSSATFWKHRFFGAQPYLLSNFHVHAWVLEKLQLWLYGLLLVKWRLCLLIPCLGLS